MLLALLACAQPTVDHRDQTGALAASCATVTASLPATPAAADTARAQGSYWSNRQIREMYVCAVSTIGAVDARRIAEGRTTEERAHLAWQDRHHARRVSRAMMDDQAEVAALRARDLAKYGDPDGPTFEWLLAKAERDGLVGDARHAAIIEGAQRTDDATNRRFGL